MSFVADDKIKQIAEAYTLDAIDFAAERFQITLDRSEDSIEQVEAVLDLLHKNIRTSRPSEDDIWIMAKMFGSYVGEVLIQHHGGQWGHITFDGETSPGTCNAAVTRFYWPWAKAHNRLKKGPEDNVWHYYMMLTNKQTGSPIVFTPKPPLWWERLWRWTKGLFGR